MRKRTTAFNEAGKIGRGGWNELKEVCASQKEKDEHPMGEEKALGNLVVKPPIPFSSRACECRKASWTLVLSVKNVKN